MALDLTTIIKRGHWYDRELQQWGTLEPTILVGLLKTKQFLRLQKSLWNHFFTRKNSPPKKVLTLLKILQENSYLYKINTFNNIEAIGQFESEIRR